jgi:hypothetical protein
MVPIIVLYKSRKPTPHPSQEGSLVSVQSLRGIKPQRDDEAIFMLFTFFIGLIALFNIFGEVISFRWLIPG